MDRADRATSFLCKDENPKESLIDKVFQTPKDELLLELTDWDEVGERRNRSPNLHMYLKPRLFHFHPINLKIYIVIVLGTSWYSKYPVNLKFIRIFMISTQKITYTFRRSFYGTFW